MANNLAFSWTIPKFFPSLKDFKAAMNGDPDSESPPLAFDWPAIRPYVLLTFVLTILL